MQYIVDRDNKFFLNLTCVTVYFLEFLFCLQRNPAEIEASDLFRPSAFLYIPVSYTWVFYRTVSKANAQKIQSVCFSCVSVFVQLI